MSPLASVTGLLDVPLVLAGHGFDFSGGRRDDGNGAGGDDGGIGTFPLVAVAVLALVTVVMLVWLSSPATKARLTAFAPMAVLAVLIALPLVAWPVLAGGDRGSERTLRIERATARGGGSELLVWLTDDSLNRLKTTSGQRSVRLQCFDGHGRVVLSRRLPWPFVEEAGFSAPHAHQPVVARLRAVIRCRLLGTRPPLTADVEGPSG